MGNRNGVSSCFVKKKKDEYKDIRHEQVLNTGNPEEHVIKSVRPLKDSPNIITNKAKDMCTTSRTVNSGDVVTIDEIEKEVGKLEKGEDYINFPGSDEKTDVEKQISNCHLLSTDDSVISTGSFPLTKDRRPDSGISIPERSDLFSDVLEATDKDPSQTERNLTSTGSINNNTSKGSIITTTESYEHSKVTVSSENKINEIKVSEVQQSRANVTDVMIEKPEGDGMSVMLQQLEGNISVYNEVLGRMYTALKHQSTDRQGQVTVQILICGNFLDRMDSYLHYCNVNSFIDLKLEDDHSKKVWPVIKKFLTITWILCDRSVNFCQYVLESKTFSFLLIELRSLSSVNYEASEIYLFAIKAVLGILHNISRHVPNSKWNLRNEGLVTVLRKFLPSLVSMIRLKTLVILSYILSEAENEIISSDDDNFVFIFQVLSDTLKSDDHRSKKYGMCTLELLRGVNNLAINDENKIRIVRNGALPLYEMILATTGFSDEKKVTIMTLWSLAFHHYNKRKMRDMPGIMEKLYELRQCEDEEICHAARGTFWELENMSKSAIGKNFSSSAEKDPNQPHIMISYQWDSQPIMMKVKDRLRHAGYKVWMDVEHMTGSTLEAMALAVEKAAVVLVCMSQKYKDSPNCRTEAEYVYRLRKDFVPLRLQCEYTPDGWLGILVGTRLYFDMYSEETLDTQLPKLVKELRDRGRISPSADTPDIGSVVPQRMISREAVPILYMSESNEVKNWDTQNILDWLTSLGLQDIYEKLYGIDGSLLLEMQKLQKVAPEFFFTMLREDFKLTTITMLKLSKAIRCLR